MRQHKKRKHVAGRKPRHQKRSTKTVYRVRNWREYNRSLVQRYSVTIWIDDEALQAWQYSGPPQQGAQFEYSDIAIECMGTLREVYCLPLRGAEGLLRSLFTLMEVELAVPCYSTLSRRGRSLTIRLPRQARGALDLVIDSSGLKVYGEGEWKVRQHGASKRRTWRKIHLAVDADHQEIQAAVLTDAGGEDAEMVAPLLAQIDNEIQSVNADGAYDKRKVYTLLAEQAPTAQVNIPPRRNAKVWQHGNSAEPALARDENLRRIREIGRKAWKRETGYHRRSLAETAMFRVKTLFGEHLSNRRYDTQATQLGLRCRALNRMTHLGMPQSYAITA